MANKAAAEKAKDDFRSIFGRVPDAQELLLLMIFTKLDGMSSDVNTTRFDVEEIKGDLKKLLP